jgi:hypothetical protein
MRQRVLNGICFSLRERAIGDKLGANEAQTAGESEREKIKGGG